MAIVPNKDGQGIKANGFYGDVDPSYEMPTAIGAVFPAVNSGYSSQLYINTADGTVYRSLQGGTTRWAETNIR
jgi:hypothetical protein